MADTSHGRGSQDRHDSHDLAALLRPVVEREGLFLEGVETTRAGRFSVVRVLVDLPDGPGDLALDSLREVTSAVSTALDEADPVRGRYTLEVSTPGVERSLTTPRHFRRAVGHDVLLVTAQGEVSGTVTQVDEAHVILDVAGEVTVVALEDVTAARMVVSGF
ncbi:ribosome maturation factor RimP [Actinomyces wuliandei]|uniref:ribosome maturation factor RimP n=1 Tax=Actinomyces wuliandei TaxID=2057743 RepID=UPI000FDBE0F9|nr:ribosome maturation factor RimP [Actinomyces wuliandei]